MNYEPGHRGQVEKGIRAIVYKRKAGFRVTIGTNKSRRIDYSEMTSRAKSIRKRWEKLRNVPLWADAGTWKRRTKKGKNCGRMSPYPFMTKTKNETTSQV